MTDYEFMDGWYADKEMRKNYQSHIIDYYAYLEDMGK